MHLDDASVVYITKNKKTSRDTAPLICADISALHVLPPSPPKKKPNLSPRSNGKLVSDQWSTEKHYSTSLNPKYGPPMWSGDTDQPISCFDSCQLTVTWMSNPTDIAMVMALLCFGFAYVWTVM